MRPVNPLLLLAALLGGLSFAPALPAADKPAVDQVKVDRAIEKGLEYLKKNQNTDGSWTAPGGGHPTTMTGMAGVALLMEGSTCREGKYSEQIDKAVKYLMRRQQGTGLLVDPRNPSEGSYTYGHGYALLFLACVYGEEEDTETRAKLEKVLKKAVDFSCKAVTKKGGWGYVSGSEGGDFDEGSTTVTQLQALRAARNAGITVPKNTIDNAIKYLKNCTTPRGGLVYNYNGPNPQAGECPAITAAACASAASTGMYKDEYFAKWVEFSKESFGSRVQNGGHDEYANLYFGPVMYMLGDDRYSELIVEKLGGDKENRRKKPLLWSDYKRMMFNHYISAQGSDGMIGAGGGWGVGPIFATSAALIIMQQEKGLVPFYQR